MTPELVTNWAKAAETGGPWFITVVLAGVLLLLTRWLYKRGEEREAKLQAEVKALQEAALAREQSCAKDRSEALAAQAKIHEDRYEALREESRRAHVSSNEEIREVAVTMTASLQQDIAAKHLQTRTLDALVVKVDQLAAEIRDVGRKV